MIAQPVPGANVAVLTTNGINFPQTQNTRPTYHNLDDLKKRLKSEIKVIAAIQIMCGVMVLSLGIILASAPFSPFFTSAFSALLKSGYPFIGGLCFIICGSLSVITEKISTEALVTGSLIMNILSVLCGLVGFFILAANLVALGPASHQCVLSQQTKPTMFYGYYYSHRGDSYRDCYVAKSSLTGVLSVMLIGTLLEVCLAALMAVLWWLQANSDFPGSVLFLNRSNKNNSNMASTVLCNPGYEELATS